MFASRINTVEAKRGFYNALRFTSACASRIGHAATKLVPLGCGSRRRADLLQVVTAWIMLRFLASTPTEATK